MKPFSTKQYEEETFFFYLDIIFFDNLFLFEIVRVNIMPKIPYGKKKTHQTIDYLHKI